MRALFLMCFFRESGKELSMEKTLTIKELPESERPYEKCMQYGAESLTDAELLAVIIRTGSSGERSVDLASRILNAGPDGLLNLQSMTIRSLMELRGIGKVKAIQLKCAAEIGKRLAMTSRRELVTLANPSSIADYFMEELRHENKEILILALFDVRKKLIGQEILTIGTASASLIDPADVYQRALQGGADSIVLLHNHPSGDPSPSAEDAAVTARVRSSGSLLGIPLMDHIIIGDNSYYSFYENQTKLI